MAEVVDEPLQLQGPAVESLAQGEGKEMDARHTVKQRIYTAHVPS
jgi:hypothetical protein